MAFATLSPSIWLLLDTGFPRGLVALVQNDKVITEVYMEEQRLHDQLLAGTIAHCLEKASLGFEDLDGIAVLKGPASFIGLRIAMAHAKGLCTALNIPLVGLPSLLSFAFEENISQDKGLIAVDARRGEFFIQDYTRVLDDNTKLPIVKGGELRSILTREFSELSLQYPCVLGFGFDATEKAKGPSASAVACLLQQELLTRIREKRVLNELLTLSPFYLRAPDAVPPRF